MIKAINLSSNQELFFTDDISPIWALAYGYCTENNLMSWLFSNQSDLNYIKQKLNIKTSKSGLTMNCDNWAIIL